MRNNRGRNKSWQVNLFTIAFFFQSIQLISLKKVRFAAYFGCLSSIFNEFEIKAKS